MTEMRYRGIGAASGFAVGPAFILTRNCGQINRRVLDSGEVETEVKRFQAQVDHAIKNLERIMEDTRQKAGEEQAKIFSTQILLLQDFEFTGTVHQTIADQSVNAEAALSDVTEMLASLFRSMEDSYMQERAADILDVSRRVMNGLLGVEEPSLEDFQESVILIAEDLTPSDTAQLDRKKVAGFAVELGGKTSHSAIIARSMGIPAVVGVKNITSHVSPGDMVILDGNEGRIYLNPPREMLEAYRNKQERYLARLRELEVYRERKSVSADGHQVELVANITGPDDAWSAKRAGAEGVGLYRTEFLYMGRQALPTEEEQFIAYKVVTGIFGPEAPIVIRTLDIGGDKELSHLKLPAEMNPFLGYRAIRLCLDRPEMFKTQLRAILRASHYGNIKLMYPMISTLQELRTANQLLSEAKRELDERNLPYNAGMEIGMMIEVPAAAMMADRFAKEIDFFSIGTNDLVQYTMAADRMNERVAHLSQPFNPAVIRLIRLVIRAAVQEGKWVGMCGEMAGSVVAIPLLAGMGLYEFSMSANSILAARALISRLRFSDLAQLGDTITEMESAEDIQNHIKQTIPEIGDLDFA